MNYVEKECPKCNNERRIEDDEGNLTLCDLCNGSGAIGWTIEDKKVSSKLITIETHHELYNNINVLVFHISGTWDKAVDMG